MKQTWIYLFSLVILFSCQAELKTKDPTIKVTDSNNVDPAWEQIEDAVADTLILTPADTVVVIKQKLLTDDIGDKRKEYPITVYFPHKNWPKLNYKDAIGADLYMVGDLDGDKLPELLLRPEWFSSCWASINLYSLKENRWKLIKTGSMYFCSDQYPLSKRIIKTEKGHALLTDSLADDKFITLKKEIKFK